MAAEEDRLPAHLAGAARHALRGAAQEVVQLTACSRVRPAAAGLLNGTIPGSAAAAAAVNLYTGAAGEIHLMCGVLDAWDGPPGLWTWQLHTPPLNPKH